MKTLLALILTAILSTACATNPNKGLNKSPCACDLNPQTVQPIS